MIQVIKNKKLYDELARVGIEGVLLCKGNGYFYLAPDSDEMAQILAKIEHSMIYCNSFRQQSIDDWVRDIQGIIGNSLQ
jgi:hypothetical protein